MNPYETQKLVDEYLLFHYATAAELLPWTGGPTDALDFAVRTPTYAKGAPSTRALDIGCAVGRSTFELSQWFNEVIGIDFSHAFIDAANILRNGGEIQYQRHDEALKSTTLTARPPLSAQPDRTSFEQGDAMDLRSDLGDFDVVHAANLICRLPDPAKLLKRLPDLVKPSGTLILATPCTWLEEFTARENFPEPTTLDWLKNQLGDHFELTQQTDEPFLIRETARKYQWSVSMLTVWQRRPS